MPGDGIGPEVINETLRLVDWLAKHRSLNFDIIERDVGRKGRHWRASKYGTCNERRKTSNYQPYEEQHKPQQGREDT